MIEPIWNRNYVEVRADHHGRELRRRGPRPLLRSGRRPARRRGQPSHAGPSRRAGWSRRHGRDPNTLNNEQRPAVEGDPARPTRRTTSAASTTATSRFPASHPESTTETYAGTAAGHRQLALVGRAVLHPHRQAAAHHADRVPARGPQGAATPGSPGLPGITIRTRTKSTIMLIRPPASRFDLQAKRAGRSEPEPIDSGDAVLEGGWRGCPRRTRYCCTPR